MVFLGTMLQNSQVKAQGNLIDYGNAWERDNQWLDDVFGTASALFKKPVAGEEEAENVNNDSDRDYVEEPDETGPILLPQTPRVKSARAARMQSKSK